MNNHDEINPLILFSAPSAPIPPPPIPDNAYIDRDGNYYVDRLGRYYIQRPS